MILIFYFYESLSQFSSRIKYKSLKTGIIFMLNESKTQLHLQEFQNVFLYLYLYLFIILVKCISKFQIL